MQETLNDFIGTVQEATNEEVKQNLTNLRKEIAEKYVSKNIMPNLDSFVRKSKISWITFFMDKEEIKEYLVDYMVDESMWDKLFWKVFESNIADLSSKEVKQLKKKKKEIMTIHSADELERELKELENSIWSDSELEQETPSTSSSWWNWETIPSATTQTVAASTWISTPIAAETWSSVSQQLATNENNPSYEIDRFNISVSAETMRLYTQLKWKEKPDLEPFACAMVWYEKLKNQLWNPTYLTVVDFTKSRRKKRFFVINMKTKTVEYATKVWHWKNSWWDYASSFSDSAWSQKSSLGFYRTPEKITKSHTKSWSGLWMNWIEESNDNAKNRWIYMHPWTETWSQWCFTIPKGISTEIMEKLKWDSLVFAYAKSKNYFAQSNYFNPRADWSLIA